MSHTFELEYDWSESVGAAAYRDSLFGVPRKVATESQSFDVTEDRVPSICAETFRHSHVFGDNEFLTIFEVLA